MTSIIYPRNSVSGANPVYQFTRDAAGRVSSVIDPLSHAVTFQHDNVDRVTSVTLPPPSAGSPLNFTTTVAYDNFDSATGLVFVHRTDPNGRMTKQGFDQYGRIGQSIDTANGVTTYQYIRDMLYKVFDANGNRVIGFAYNKNKWVSATSHENALLESYTYFSNGLLKTVTDRKNQIITYNYDGLDRLTKKTYPDSTSDTFTYTGQKLTKVVDTFANPDETFLFGYDASYRINSETQATRGVITYGYDAADRLASYSLQSGPSAAYTYYSNGSLKTLQWSATAGQFDFGYRLNGQYDTVAFPNGQQRKYNFDDQGRLMQITNTHPSAGNLGTFNYGYDAPGMLGLRSNMADASGTTGYSYDNRYQLSQVVYPNADVHSGTYDSIGNRLTSTVNGNAASSNYNKFSGNPNNSFQLQSDGSHNYTYDNNGNTTADGTYNFTYNYDNRMTAISGSGLSASYKYDFAGRRVSKAVGGQTTSYIYAGEDLIAERGANTADYVFGPGIDEPLALSRSGAISYYNADGLGSVRSLTDSAGTIQNSYSYDAWGVIQNQSVTIPQPFGYTAREFGEAGLWYYRARYMNPATGRFMNEDPLRLVAGMNYYAYVGSNPTNFIDPLGWNATQTTQGGQTVVTVYLDLFGPEATQDYADRIHQGVDELVDKSNINIDIEVDIRLNPNPNVLPPAMNRDRILVGDYNESQVVKDAGNRHNPCRSANGHFRTDAPPYELAHEIGHLLGLPEGYDPNAKTNLYLPGDSFMKEMTHGVVTSQDVQGILLVPKQ